MIRSFVDWIRALLLVSFVVTLIQAVLPDNTLRPYVKLVLGFVVLAMLVGPIVGFIENPSEWRSMFNTVLIQPASLRADNLIQIGQDIEQRGIDVAMNHLGDRLGHQIEAIVALLDEVDEVVVDTVDIKGGGIETIVIRLHGQSVPGDARVRDLLFKYFGIPQSSIVTDWITREGE